MIDTPEIVDLPARPIAVIHVTVPRSEIRQVMGPGLLELRSEVEAQGVETVGPWFTHHFRIEPTVFDFEIGHEVASRVAAAGRMSPSEQPAMRAARTVYHGEYEGLGAAWGGFDAWIRSQELDPAEDLWETYEVGPESGPDPAGWRTVLVRPLR
jgi:effector-binding domain-containing protein